MFCLCGNPSENEETGDCASCGASKRKAVRNASKKAEALKFKRRIAKFSKNRSKQNAEYYRELKKFLEGKQCAVFPELKATDVHHMKGRIGYADQWAREHHITLLMDQRFWLAVSRPGHTRIELNPTWAREIGFSMERSEIMK